MNIEDIPTPALVIDLAIVERNLHRMASYAAKHHLALRPHTKTHKSLRMARLQLEAGASGLTVAKAGEAEVMAEAAEDLLIAYPALDPARSNRLAKLAKTRTVRVAIDSDFAIDALASAARAAGVTLGLLVEMDVGFHRTGVHSPREALKLAEHIDQSEGVRLDGLLCFPGQINDPPAKQKQTLQPIAELLSQTVQLWKKQGLEAKIVSGGSTPTALQSHLIPALTEIRPGTYLYNDLNTVKVDACSLDDCAARILCTVVSNAVSGKVVLDAGSKTLTSDRAVDDPLHGGFGHVVEYPEAKVVRLSEEHGEVDIRWCEHRPQLGQRVHVIPNHICPCVNLQDSAWLATADGSLEALPIDARGKLS